MVGLARILQDAKSIHGNKKYTELSAQKAGSFFTTSALKEASMAFAESSEEYQREQSGLVKEIVGIAGVCSR